jgi:retron-type reverse transcriptase
VMEAQQYQADGYRWVVDLDLEKFFDRVNHDRLMSAVARRVTDKRMLRLIRAFLNAGVMNGLESDRRRDAARRSFVAPAVKPGTGRTRPRVDAARAPVCAVCGRQ